jgi:hypothetical protein
VSGEWAVPPAIINGPFSTHLLCGEPPAYLVSQSLNQGRAATTSKVQAPELGVKVQKGFR